MKIRKKQRSGETIGTTIEIPKEISLKLARLILDKSERGEQLTKPELILRYVQQGLEKEEEINWNGYIE